MERICVEGPMSPQLVAAGTGVSRVALNSFFEQGQMTSCKSSIRFPAASACCVDRPVTLPPGRAKLLTRPLPTGSPTTVN
jgi:hypothetical protein